MRATSGQYAPNALGYTRAAMPQTMRCNAERRSKSPKLRLSSDRGLGLTLVKTESLVTAFQHGAVNTSLLLALTARHTIRVGWG